MTTPVDHVAEDEGDPVLPAGTVNAPLDWSTFVQGWRTSKLQYDVSPQDAQLVLDAFGFWKWIGPGPGLFILAFFVMKGAWIAAAETVVAIAVLEVNRRWAIADPKGRRRGVGTLVWAATLSTVIAANALTTGGIMALTLIVLLTIPFGATPALGVKGAAILSLVIAAMVVGVHVAPQVWDIPQEFVPTGTDRLVVWLGLLAASTVMGAQAYLETERSKEFIRDQAAELAEARDQAEAASRAKTDFLATMSHELRTPLHGVTAALDLLDRQDLPPEVRRRVDTALASAADAARVVNDVLDFSRIEAEGLETELVPFSPAELVTQSVDVVRALAERKGLAVHTTVADGVPAMLRGDADKLRRVLVNLLGNAVKFTEVGSVSITLEWDLGNLSVAVADTGVGIDPAAQERLFDKFEQADTSTTRRFGGTGLGLTISRRLVRHLGGDIAVESQPGVGSRFSFTVPAPVAEDTEAVTLVPLPALSVPADAPDRERGPADGPLVLVVDDLAVNAALVGEMLEALGCRSIWAADGEAALAEVAARPDIAAALLDSHLPGMHGNEIAAAIRRGPRGDMRLIGLTADVSSGNLADARTAGMDRVIGKPARLPVIRDTLRQLGVLERWFDPAPLVEARALVLADGADDDHRRAVALLEPAYERAAALCEDLRGDDARLDLFHRAHGNLVGSLVYAVELARRPQLSDGQRRHLVACLERAIAWEDV